MSVVSSLFGLLRGRRRPAPAGRGPGEPPRPRARPKAVPAAQRLQLAYEPRRDGRADPGEVVWTWVPYEDDPRQGKDRPVLVIGRLGADLAVLPLTSRSQDHRDDTVFLGAGGWDGGGKDSWVKLDQLLRVSPSKVRREGATLDKARFDRVLDAWRAQAGGN